MTDDLLELKPAHPPPARRGPRTARFHAGGAGGRRPDPGVPDRAALAGLNGALRTAKNAAVGGEINQLAQAL
ncbi:MAG TPA: hypothetical protein VKF17_02535, partial [Isosphaeraceae bacterium]|nr:hypothetical protein [Isosphaeraceae bacterium]